MRPALKHIIVLLAAATPLAAGGCHNEADCGGQTLPAGVELEIALTQVSSNEGCDGFGATLDDEPVRYATSEPVDVGAHNKCLSETLEPPSGGELYGVTIDFCYTVPGGFACEGNLVACPEQSARLDVAVHFGDLPASGSDSAGLYSVDVSADAQAGCSAVRCRQLFEALTTRL